uniref:mitogen-activated protein kinase kinase n=1 Tax=Acrobeloides nanus TaxID=290746 RepID=A0A914DM39_9BILA
MHRDVKPSNVLVNKNGEVKLCDFGHAKILELGSMTSSFKCTLQYLPPERFEDDQPEGYDDRTDVWSLGITLVEIAYGDIPYNVKGLRPNEDYAKIRNIIKNANRDEIMSRCFGCYKSHKTLTSLPDLSKKHNIQIMMSSILQFLRNESLISIENDIFQISWDHQA